MESLCLRDHFSSSPPVFATDGLPHHRKFSQCWQQSRGRRLTRGIVKLRIPHVPHGGTRHPLKSRCNEAGTAHLPLRERHSCPNTRRLLNSLSQYSPMSANSFGVG